MRDDMYTYHYTRNRAIKPSPRFANFIYHFSMVAALAYLGVVVYNLVH